MYKPLPTDVITVHDLENTKYSSETLFYVIGYQQVHEGDERIVLLDPEKDYLMTPLENVKEIKENLGIKDMPWAKESDDKT